MPPRKKAAAAPQSPSAAPDAVPDAAVSDSPVDDLQQLETPSAVAEESLVESADHHVLADAHPHSPHSSPQCATSSSVAAVSPTASPAPTTSPHPPAADLSPTKVDLNMPVEDSCRAAGEQFNLVFLGTGVSTTIPKLSHFLSGSCAVCNDAAARPFSKNRRNNVSALITVPISPDEAAAAAAAATLTPADGGSADSRDRFWGASSIAKTSRYICIDFSPTIRDSAMRFFPAAGCRSLDAVLLSHVHYDAVGGLDYIREFQTFSKTEAEDGTVRFHNDEDSRITVYADEPSLKQLSATVPYLFQSGPTPTPVAQLNWRALHMMEEHKVCGLTVVPFTMSHHRSFDNSTCIGSDCTGFVFNNGALVWMSDVVQVSAELTVLLQQLPRIGLLVIDACRDSASTNSHFSLDEAIAFVKEIKPFRALFVGMCCEIDHDPTCARLRTLSVESGIELALAYDGQSIGPFPLPASYSILDAAATTTTSAPATAPASTSSTKRPRESLDSSAVASSQSEAASAAPAPAVPPVFRSAAPIHQPNSRLFVAGLPPTVTAAELTEKFKEFGAVTQDIWIKPGAVYTHIQMESTDAAARALKACKGLVLKGSEITVKLADNRFAKPGEDRWKDKEVPYAELHTRKSSRDDEPLSREEEARRREDIINKAFPLDQKITSEQIRQRRKILGRDLRPGMSEKEVELLLFDEGFLSDRRVWNACEELELQFLSMIEDQTQQLNSLADKRARAHEAMRAEAREMMLRASSERERDEIKMKYQRRHAQLDSETDERVALAKKEHRSATTSWKRARQARLGALHIPGFISQGLPPHNMFDVLDLVWDLLKAKNIYRTGTIRLPPKAPAHQLPPPSHAHPSRGDDWGRGGGGVMERGPDRGGGGYFQPPHADVGPYGGGGGGYFPPVMSGAGAPPMAGGGGGGSILARYGLGGASGSGGAGYGQPPPPAHGGAGGYGQAAPPVGSYGSAPPPVQGGGYGHAPPHFGGGGFVDGQDMRGGEWGYR